MPSKLLNAGAEISFILDLRIERGFRRDFRIRYIPHRGDGLQGAYLFFRPAERRGELCLLWDLVGAEQLHPHVPHFRYFAGRGEGR